MTSFPLRTRVSIALLASLFTGAVALAVGARHLHASYLLRDTTTEQEFVHSVWWTLGLVIGIANITGVSIVVLTARTLDARIARLRNAVLALGYTSAESYQPMLEQDGPDDELLPIREAVHAARLQLRDAMVRVHTESERNRVIIDTVMASVFSVDGVGRIIHANPAAAHMFAQSCVALQGVMLTDLITLDSLRMSSNEYGTLRFTGNDAERQFTTRIRVFGHASFPANVVVTPLALHGQQAWAMFVHDLSDTYRAAATLDEARRAAESANRSKSAFLSRMSHELRTPLSAMISFTKLVRRSRNSQLCERDGHFLDRVQDSSEQLLSLVNEIVELARMDSGSLAMQLEPTDISAMVRQLLATFDDQVAERPVLLEAALPELPACALIDAKRLRQVLTNLIGNAVKFTARGRITVTVCARLDSGVATAVIVRDTGIGIPLERQSQIFELFEQADEETGHRYGGSGLGLALSRRIAEQMGCMLSVESMPGAGSIFTLHFSQQPDVAASLRDVASTSAS